MALQNNQALLSAREGVRIANQRIAEARSLIWPSLAVNLNASRYRTEDHAVLAGDSGSTLLPPSFNGEADNYYSGRLALRQVLYNGGRTLANTRLAQAALEQARIREEEIRRQVTVDVTGAFYGELVARKQLALSEEAQRDLERCAAASGPCRRRRPGGAGSARRAPPSGPGRTPPGRRARVFDVLEHLGA
ncbi:MAG: TolC family protein [Elusimicrobia bacterium]|nr:TolC family protein [Elusimicrobiota bacterium]